MIRPRSFSLGIERQVVCIRTTGFHGFTVDGGLHTSRAPASSVATRRRWVEPQGRLSDPWGFAFRSSTGFARVEVVNFAPSVRLRTVLLVALGFGIVAWNWAGAASGLEPVPVVRNSWRGAAPYAASTTPAKAFSRACSRVLGSKPHHRPQSDLSPARGTGRNYSILSYFRTPTTSTLSRLDLKGIDSVVSVFPDTS